MNQEEEVQDLGDLKDSLLHPSVSTQEEEEQSKLTIDEILQKWSGEFGWWQLRHFVLTSLAWTLEAMHTMVMIFADRQPRWQCKISVEERFSLINRTVANLQWIESCSPGGSICSMAETSWEWIEGAAASTVSEWGLICGEQYKVGVVQSAFFVGCLFGAGIFGHLSDSSLGRKGTLTMVCTFNAVLGVLTAFSPNYWIYLILRLLTGICVGGVGLCAFVLATEPVGPTKRGPVGMSVFYLFSLGVTALPAISYLCPTWRSLYVATSIPSALFCLFVLPFVSESPRWYLVRGRLREATDIMRSIALKNGNEMPKGVSLTLDNQQQSKEGDEASGNLVDAFKSRVTRNRIIIMVFVWFACAVVYYGLSLNVVNLSSNLYLSVFLNGIAEMPAFALTAALLNKFGRRSMLVLTMLLSGISSVIGSVISAFIHKPGKAAGPAMGILIGAQLACALLGIFGMAGTYNLLYIYTSELFPTVVRNAALGLTSQAGHIGAIIAPLVVVTGGTSPWLPFAMVGVAGIIGGILGVRLPETLNRPMYETMAGLEYGDLSIPNTR